MQFLADIEFQSLQFGVDTRRATPSGSFLLANALKAKF